jgi:DNA mismatch repair protein MutS
MGGKSTVMRQVALIIILGQMGAPVPAQSARWGAVSQMHTRIGAHDAIARGQSTFMVEMTELAHILHHADERSFIVLDEIGRGTSTYDGISVAWATLEWICKKIRCRTLFATHYHELTMLATSLPLVANAHMAVEGARALKGGNLRFLYELREGPANESFGVHVAQLAGLPAPVIDRSWKILEELEHHAVLGRNPKEQTAQLSLFSVQPAATPAPTPASEPPKECQKPDPTREAVIKEISTLALDEFTPLQALNLLARLQKDLTCSITGKSLH